MRKNHTIKDLLSSTDLTHLIFFSPYLFIYFNLSICVHLDTSTT